MLQNLKSVFIQDEAFICIAVKILRFPFTLAHALVYFSPI